MVEDEESLSNTKGSILEGKSTMEEEKLDKEAITSEGQCESLRKLDDSILSGCDVKDEVVVTEDKPAEEEGGKECDGVDRDEAAETGLDVELNVGHQTVFNAVDCGQSGQVAVEGIPVVEGEVKAVEEDSGEMTLSNVGVLGVVEKGGEDLMPVADGKVEASSDGEMAGSDKKLTPTAEQKVETVVVREELKASEGGGMAVSDVGNLEHGKKDCDMVIAREELETSRGAEMAISDVAESALGKERREASLGSEMAVSHVGDLELGNNGGEDLVTVGDAKVESVTLREESEASDAKTVTENEVELGTREKVSIDEVKEVSTEGAIECKEKVAVGLIDSEIGVADELIAEEISISKDKVDSEMINDANSAVVSVSAGNQVHGLDGGIGIDETESLEAAKDEYAADKRVVAKDGLLATQVVQEKDMNMDVSKDSESNKPVNAAEIVEEAVAEEDIPAAATELETETVAGSGNLAERFVSKDTILTVESEMEIERTTDDVSEFGQEEGDSMDALQDEEDENMVAQDETRTQDTEMETEIIVSGSAKGTGGKQKKGKKSKIPKGRKLVGDDVCFICFDGGDLVMCDRRGCPKAYHPSCVNRDEAFFKAKGIWNCGWHLCSICEKNAYYKCYTCAYSLCRGCIKDAVILCVRGNKGFCETCMRFVLLIENNDQGNKDAEIDFDDKSSWEYLFKDYYIELKSKLNLSSDEVANAKNPWKGIASTIKESPEAQVDGNDGEGSGSDATENFETPKPKRRKLKKHSKSPFKKDKLVSSAATAGNECNSVSGNAKWASEELLEFVSHMKNGDTSVLSQFSVQALLLEYIRRNNLRDPRRKSQIRCDAQLENLFGKSRVGHFEMLKLLESHFLTNEDSPMDDVQGSVVDTESDLLEADGNDDTVTKGPSDKKRKKRKKGDNRAPQSNVAEYAAIDTHNISLIYLRRKLIEDLLEDIETFHDKVVGTFVRIRISGSSQKQDMYRLVQVVGTCKASEPYKISKRTSNIVLEILNLNKTEIIPIDIVSNQEFTEEECKRLRQSIKCGLISRLTVGDILEKAMETQAARVNDWLESEILRLGHLCDRASDLGRRKELRECVEKLQLLKTPDERRRRLEEIPKIHADPKMDPSYESDDDGSETDESPRDAYMGSRGSGFSSRERGPISPRSNHFTVGSWAGAGDSRNLSGTNISNESIEIVQKVSDNSWNQGRERDTRDRESNNLEMRSSTTHGEPIAQNVTVSTVSLVTSPTPVSAGVVETSTSVKINETEKMWLYKDPSGNIQGPFSLVQLRRWSNTGYFPADLRVWRTTEKQEDSVLLNDVLAGKCLKELPEVGNKQHDPNISSDQFAKSETHGTSLHLDMKRLNAEQKLVQNSNLSDRKSIGNDPRNLPSSTPKQSKWDQAGDGAHLPVVTQRAALSAVLKSPGVALSQLRTDSFASSLPASSPASKPEQVGLISGDFLQTPKLAVTSEPHAVQDVTIQSVQYAINRAAISGSDSAPSQKVEPDASIPQSGENQIRGWGGSTMSTVQNFAGDSSNSGTPVVPQSDFWQPPISGFQSNMQTPGMANVPWAMQANPTTGWGDQTAGIMNMNWAPVQVQPTGNTTSGPTTVQGTVSGNVNPGWFATPIWGPPNGNTGTAVQGLVPGWGPPAGIGAPPIQAPPVGMGPPVQAAPQDGASFQGPTPPGISAPLQGPPQGNSSQGWGAPAGVQGMWGGPQNPNGAPYPGGFSGGRPWNGQQSLGRGGPRPFNKRNKPCPYNTNGQCRKGAYCDYLHT